MCPIHYSEYKVSSYSYEPEYTEEGFMKYHRKPQDFDQALQALASLYTCLWTHADLCRPVQTRANPMPSTVRLDMGTFGACGCQGKHEGLLKTTSGPPALFI